MVVFRRVAIDLLKGGGGVRRKRTDSDIYIWYLCSSDVVVTVPVALGWGGQGFPAAHGPDSSRKRYILALDPVPPSYDPWIVVISQKPGTTFSGINSNCLEAI